MQDIPNDYEDEETSQPGRDVVIVFIVFFEAGLAPFALALGWLVGQNPLAQLSWGFREVGYGILASIPMILFMILIIKWPIGPFQNIRRLCDEEIVPLLAGSHWYELLMIAVAAGVGEEMLFRGVIQASVQNWLTSPLLGLVVASVFFGLLHPVSLTYIVIAFLLGSYLGWIFLYSGNLLTVMVAHAFYDLGALGFLLKWPPSFLDDGEPAE